MLISECWAGRPHLIDSSTSERSAPDHGATQSTANSEEAVTLSELLIILLFMVSILITVSSLDDAFIDLLAVGIVRLRLPGLAECPHAIPKTDVFQTGTRRMCLGRWSRATSLVSRARRFHSSSECIQTTP